MIFYCKQQNPKTRQHHVLKYYNIRGISNLKKMKLETFYILFWYRPLFDFGWHLEWLEFIIDAQKTQPSCYFESSETDAVSWWVFIPHILNLSNCFFTIFRCRATAVVKIICRAFHIQISAFHLVAISTTTAWHKICI